MTTDSSLKAGRKEWIGLGVLALPSLLLSLDISVLLLALPQLSADLGAGSIQQLWITDIYGFMIAGFLVTMGTLGDRIGRRKLLLIGAAAFGVASVVAAYSVNPEMLIVTRALLGIAGATVLPSTLALVSNMFRDPAQKGFAIAAVFSCFLAGGAFGPVVGGVLLEFFWWGSVFLLGVPVMALLLVLGPMLLPEYRDPEGGRLDLASVALSLVTILPVVYGLKELAKDGPAPLPLAALAIGVAFGAAFVSRQRRLADPLLDLSLFGDRSFSAALSINVCGGIVLGGIFLFVTQYLQLIEGLSPLRAGLWLVPATFAMIAGTMIAPAIAQRIRPAYVMAAGMAIAALGFLLLTRLGGEGDLVVVVAGFTVGLFGLGLPGGVGINMIVGSAPPEKAGSASSMSETSQELGLSLGFATLGSLGVAVYRSRISDAIPSGLPSRAAETARESLAGAVSVADALPAPLGAGLLGSAREAFTAGLTTAAGIGAVVFVALAVLAIATLRHVPAAGEVRTEEAERTPAVALGADHDNKGPMYIPS
jgi:DHA2 family multidrug resistance protein-like MFS transporter